ncbi:MAG: TrkA family potassium uptake protein [Angelakisella sp.]|nr:TrkA family potassium uptake protein [Angelakisella sp.]
MNILIIGCGKVGSGLANSLYKMGHDISVIDAHEENFLRLEEAFTGFTIQGVPIDLDVLKRGGIEACDFLVAVYDDDNVNVMVSQVAREIFQVPKVLTRIYDPRRKNVFSEFGLHTICPTSLTVDVIEKLIDNEEHSVRFVFGSSNMSAGQLEIPPECIGLKLQEMEHDDNEMAVGVVHADGSVMLRDAEPEYRLQESDRLLVLRTI